MTFRIGATQGSMVSLPCPHSMSVGLMDIDAGTTTRSASGKMLRDRVCGGAASKRKLEVEWVALTSGDMQQILQSIAEPFFYVQYPDPYTASLRTARFYAGDRSAPILSTNLHGRGMLWERLKLNLIEE